MIHSCKVMGDTYNIALAPADKQLEALYIIEQTYIQTIYSARGLVDVDVMMVRNVLADREYFSFEDLQKLQSILLYKVFKEGGDSSLTVDDFHGKIETWRMLLAEALMANFADFFISAQKGAKDQVEKIMAKAKAQKETL